ncbi:MAG: TIGR00366 family protein, partial [Oscillospiraceae bacterium]|nr:TIGR00366 family protein [Oscillospiraceae bacterium]
MPDPFLFAVILSIIVYAAAIFATGLGPIEILATWGSSSGFWNLLSFSMQMAL